MEQLDESSCQTTGKRKLACCEQKVEKRKVRDHQCPYCDRTFRREDSLDNHIKDVHKCRICRELVLTEEIRAEHEQKHKEEKQKEAELEMQRKQKEEDLVSNYIRANKLDEYESDSDYEPDFHDIFYIYNLDNGEVLSFMKRFKVDVLYQISEECFSVETIIYLMENDAVSVEDVSWFLDEKASYVYHCDLSAGILSYFLDKGYAIKPEWVAMIIDETELVERIKLKHAFTFDEVYGERAEVMRQSDNRDEDDIKAFYVKVHEYFPDPEFEDPFADPFIDFKEVSTEHVNDYLHSRYFYDEENDELSIVIMSDYGEREIPLGECKDMLKMDLQDLIVRYHKAIKGYEDANRKVSKLFEQKDDDLDEDLHGDLTENQRLNVLDQYDHELYRDAIPERNDYANDVSKLYFVIAQK